MNVIAVLCRDAPGARFDMGHCNGTHLPLVRRLLAPMGMRSLTYLVPEPGGPWRLIAELRFDDRAALEAALAAHGAETQADIPNLTDIRPEIVIGTERTA